MITQAPKTHTSSEVVGHGDAMHRGRLLRILGLGFGLAATVGISIGMGILRTPGDVAAQLPDTRWFLGVWIAGALYALLGAICVAEVVVLLARSGGFYNLGRRAYGPPIGFVAGWADWLVICGSVTAMSLVVGEYAGVLVPALAPHTKALALALPIGFAVLHWRGIRWGSRAQEITCLLKALAFIALIAGCFVLGGSSAVSASAALPFPAGKGLVIALVLALQGVMWTYSGWETPIYFAEEIRDPGRNIPRTMFFGALATSLIYLLLILAMLHVLPLSQLAGAKLAAGDAARVVFGPAGEKVLGVLVILSLLSAINATLLSAPRILLTMSRDGLFPQAVAAVNAGGTPTTALLVSAAVALLFLVGGPTVERLLGILAFFTVMNYAMAFAAVFVLRRREPDTPRPYRAWGHPWTTAAGLLASIAFLAAAIYADVADPGTTYSSLFALGLLAGTVLLYGVWKTMRRNGVKGEMSEL